MRPPPTVRCGRRQRGRPAQRDVAGVGRQRVLRVRAPLYSAICLPTNYCHPRLGEALPAGPHVGGWLLDRRSGPPAPQLPTRRRRGARADDCPPARRRNRPRGARDCAPRVFWGREGRVHPAHHAYVSVADTTLRRALPPPPISRARSAPRLPPPRWSRPLSAATVVTLASRSVSHTPTRPAGGLTAHPLRCRVCLVTRAAVPRFFFFPAGCSLSYFGPPTCGHVSVAQRGAAAACHLLPTRPLPSQHPFRVR